VVCCCSCSYKAIEDRAIEPLAEQVLKSLPAETWYLALAKAQFACERGSPLQAAEHYRLLSESRFRPSHAGELLPVKSECLVRLADVCVQVGSVTDAATLYAALRPLATCFVSEGGLISYGAAGRALAELAQRMDDCATAERHFEHAIAMNRSMGHRPEQVRAQLGLARLLARLKRFREARSLASAAREDAAVLGMPPMLALAERVLAGAEG